MYGEQDEFEDFVDRLSADSIRGIISDIREQLRMMSKDPWFTPDASKAHTELMSEYTWWVAALEYKLGYVNDATA